MNNEESSLKTVLENNDTLTKDIFLIQQKVNSARKEYLSLRNEKNLHISVINSLESAPPLMPPADNSGNDLLPAHNVTINGRISTLNQKKGLIDKANTRISDLMNQYEKVLQDNYGLYQLYKKGANQNDYYSALSSSYDAEKRFLSEQLNEMNREMVQLSSIRSDTVNLMNQIEGRLHSVEHIQAQDLSHAIASKQEELLKAEESINAIRKKSYNLTIYSNQKDFEQKSEQENNKQKADWLNEKQFLQNTLSESKKELDLLKKESSQQQKTQSIANNPYNDKLSATQESMYSSILRAWSGSLEGSSVYNGTISSGWEKIQEPRKELAKLLAENLKKEKELSMRKLALERAVKKFHNRENNAITAQKDHDNEFKAEEEKLLQKIKQTKMLIAQSKLKQGM